MNLGGVLGLGVTAEGVEQIGQLDRLRALGCQQAQGFLFAKPMRDDDLRRFLMNPVPVAPKALTPS